VAALAELLKVAALAALVGMLASALWDPFTAATLGVGTFWLLLVRVT
jgi:hypothetical protein